MRWTYDADVDAMYITLLDDAAISGQITLAGVSKERLSSTEPGRESMS